MRFLTSCFYAAMLFIMGAAAMEDDDRRWINYLADDSKRRKPRNRARYSKSCYWNKKPPQA